MDWVGTFAVMVIFFAVMVIFLGIVIWAFSVHFKWIRALIKYLWAKTAGQGKSQPMDQGVPPSSPAGRELMLDVMRLWFHASVGSPQGQQILGGMQQSGYTLTEALVEMLDIGFGSSFCRSVQDAAQVQGFESTWASYRGREREVFLEQTLSYLQVRVGLGEYPEGIAEQVVARLRS